MTREMEEIYTAVFGRPMKFSAHIFIVLIVFNIPARGDGKKACKRLRAKATFKSHHFNTFRSGLLFGFAIFALIDGLLKGQYFEPHDLKDSFMKIYSTPTRDSTSNTMLGYLAFYI